MEKAIKDEFPAILSQVSPIHLGALFFPYYHLLFQIFLSVIKFKISSSHFLFSMEIEIKNEFPAIIFFLSKLRVY